MNTYTSSLQLALLLLGIALVVGVHIYNRFEIKRAAHNQQNFAASSAHSPKAPHVAKMAHAREISSLENDVESRLNPSHITVEKKPSFWQKLFSKKHPHPLKTLHPLNVLNRALVQC